MENCWDSPGLPHYLFFGSTSMEVSIYFHGSFHQLPWNLILNFSGMKIPWKLIPPTTREVNQHIWQLAPTSMEANLLSFASMEVASFSSFIYFHESFHLLTSTPMEAPMEVSRPASIQVAPASMEATNYFHALPSTSSHGSWK